MPLRNGLIGGNERQAVILAKRIKANDISSSLFAVGLSFLILGQYLFFGAAIVFVFFLIFGGKCRLAKCEPARCAENKKGRKQKKRNGCNNCVSVSLFRRMWNGAKCAVLLCAENEKEKAENQKQRHLFNISLYYLYATLFFSLSAGVGRQNLSRSAMDR